MTLHGKEVMDLVTRMLDAMSDYDYVLGHFGDIREHVLNHPPIEPDVITSLNRACYEYMRDSGARHIPEHDDEQSELIQALPNAEDMGDRLHYLGIAPDENLAYGIVLWAAAMSASRFALTPWNHLYRVICGESAGMPREEEGDAQA
jgi:hypothetical protein